MGAKLKSTSMPRFFDWLRNGSTKETIPVNRFEGITQEGAIVLRDRRGTLKAELPNITEKSETLGNDPLAIYKPTGAKNIDAAKAAGIRTDRVLWIVIVSGSVLAALAGLLLSGRLASVASAQGNGYIFTVFAAAVIGGISLNGGKGSMFGAFTGILLLFLIQNVLTLGGVPAQWIGALNGAIILVALVISRITGGKVQD